MDDEAKVIEEFTKAMLAKLEVRKNRYAPMGWKTMDMKRIFSLLKGELEELMEDGADMEDEAIDVANYAMFIWAITKSKK